MDTEKPIELKLMQHFQKFIFCLLLFFIDLDLNSYELSVVTLFRNEANYLKEWIEYHHMLGVDHFLLYNDRSEDNWAEVLEPYIQSNLVEVFPWHKSPTTPLFPCWQIEAFQDGLKRSKGNTTWIAFIDVDEFILPKRHATIPECLKQLYSSASGIYICWRNFGTGGEYIDPGAPILMRLTTASHPHHPRNSSGKSIVKVDDVMIDRLWSPHQCVLRPGAQYYNGSGRPLYFLGDDLQVNQKHTSDYMQINHYAMRDENFYQNVRLPKAISQEYGNLNLLKEHYVQFNYVRDQSIVNFIKQRHFDMYRTFWHGRD